MNRHTADLWSIQGPMTLHGRDTDLAYLVVYLDADDPDKRREIALVGAWDVEGEHNARLVAAVPKLLAACRGVVHGWEQGDPAEAVRTCRTLLAELSKPTDRDDAAPATARTIRLPCYGITIRLDSENTGERPGCGTITSELKEAEEDGEGMQFNAAMDGLESLILAHACAGIDVQSPAYVEGIETAVDAISNNL